VLEAIWRPWEQLATAAQRGHTVAPPAQNDNDGFNSRTTSEPRKDIKEKLRLFGLAPGGKPVKQGWLHLMLLLWKFIIIGLTAASLEDATLQPHAVWRSAWLRLRSKVLAKSEVLKARVRRALSRGREPPDVSGATSVIEPIAKYGSTGEVEWNESIVKKLEQLGEPPPKPTRPRAGQRGQDQSRSAAQPPGGTHTR